ncbi:MULTISPECIES: DUF5666 domain-containing protein [Kitasatospora]|uniref:Uncharacterized protein n=1 Tax=Kitasatospora setae (strain ATCC 33774 / DSM 43861 / JCM 3304 / KCC A-0304 / NBRC 14216 / KM-6054) TaxID=452652 RepID=E4NEM5_KITSK|nr:MULTISPECIES: DUF5666 domain-containing protein [Kitasatospora]BAJ29811.1 hypothetical protein KSE_40190 [Kitasatospora setae KM-6054]
MSDDQELLATAPDARDITAELAAPPRRKLPWPTLALAGCVIAVLSFAGGAWYQKDSGSTGSGTRAGAGSDRAPGTGRGGYGGGNGGGQFPGGGNGGGGGAAGGFTRGTVKSVEGDTVYLTDANGNTVKVTTQDSTKVTTTKEGKVGDLQPGQTVTVLGSKAADGSYSATQLTEGGAAGGFGGNRGGGTGTTGGSGNR